MPLPVHLAHTGKIRVRPVGNDVLWSEVLSLPDLLCVRESKLHLHHDVLCYSSHRTERPFWCCITVGHSPLPAVDEKYGEVMRDGMEGARVPVERLEVFKQWNIAIQAPLLVTNCLPYPLGIDIDTGAGMVVNHLAPGASSIPVSLLCRIVKRNSRIYWCSYFSSDSHF